MSNHAQTGDDPEQQGCLCCAAPDCVAEGPAELQQANDRLTQEVSDHQRAEQALRESQADLNHAQAVAHIGSWRLDVRRNALHRSEEAYRIFGISDGTALTYETFLATVHPEDRDFVDKAWQAALRGEPYDIEHRIVGGGQVKWVRERAELEFDERGGLRGGFGTTQDITERKRAEEARLGAVVVLHDVTDAPRAEADLARANELLQREVGEHGRAAQQLATQSAVTRVLAEQGSGDALAYLQGIVETVREPLLVLDASLRVKSANRSFYQTFRVNRAETEGQFLYDLGNGQWNIPRLRELLEEILPRNSHFDEFEVAHEFAGIGRRTMLLNARRVYREGSGAELVLLAIEDVTERRRAAYALNVSETRYRRLFETAQDGILILDADTRQIIDANPFLTEILGYHHDELVGKELWEIGLFRDIETNKTAFRELQEEGFIRYEDLPLQTRGGRCIDVEFISNVYFVDPQRIIQCNIRDISARKRAEDALREAHSHLEELVVTRTAALQQANDRLTQYRLLYESSRDAIMTLAPPTWRFISGNPATVKMFGVKSEEEFTCHGPWKFSPERQPDGRASAEKAIEIIETAMREGSHFFEWTHRRLNGEVFPATVLLSRIMLPGKAFLQATVRDITEQKRAEEELRQAKEAAEAASLAKSAFLAAMSHEIRTPMNGILGMTELALDTDLTAEQRERLGLVKRSADSLMTVINDILDFSKIEAGKLQLEQSPFALREALDDVVSVLGVRAGQKGLELTCRVAPDVPDALLGDPGRLRQVLVNLIGNATKFTEQGEVALGVEVHGRQSGTAALRFAVRDTGPGIPDALQRLIFEPFAQVDGGLTRKHEGTGLGLTIASRLVEMMGGELAVESQVGRGSTFHFTACFKPQQGPVEHVVPAPPEQLRAVRVLVVDDNATSRGMLAELLGSWGAWPTCAEDGRAALAALHQARCAGEPFRLILLDAFIPEMDGFELAGQIRAGAGAAPGPGGALIMMLPSAGRPQDAARCRDLGAAEVLTKPVRQATLYRAVLKALGAAPAEVYAPAPGPPPLSPRQSLRILLAEDNPVNQKLAVSLLEKQGHAVTVANNGREALEALEGQPAFDLVFMDVQMPVMDGLQATAAIRARERGTGQHLPVIALTAYAMKGDREQCLQAGMDGYVAKPIRPQDLLGAIASAVPACAGADEREVRHGEARLPA